MNRELLVYLSLGQETPLVGRLWSRSGARGDSASFEYDPAWLRRPDACMLDPELALGAGQFHTARALFRAFTDPAPDRWGQTLLRRAERAKARREGRTPRTLTSLDFLILVHDETRLGALRFKEANDSAGDFLSSLGKPVPPLLDLPRLLAATGRIINDSESDDDLALVLAPGTSLGGARPKASVRAADGKLLVAKFPRKDDEWPVTRWEATSLALAQASGIQVPVFRLDLIAKKPVLILDRFDRDGGERIPFMSAMTALSANDNEAHSYVELVQALRRHGAQVERDARELFRRLVFNILISNTDDHLRNHGFLYDHRGLRLAPAYDLNPVPVDVRPRVHALAINETDASASLGTAFGAAPAFGLKMAAARTIASEVAKSVSHWRSVATKFGLKPKELGRMESAFDHDDLKAALRC